MSRDTKKRHVNDELSKKRRKLSKTLERESNQILFYQLTVASTYDIGIAVLRPSKYQ
jgi:hypothetical protein